MENLESKLSKENQKVLSIKKQIAENQQKILQLESKVADILCDLTSKTVERIGENEYIKQMKNLS